MFWSNKTRRMASCHRRLGGRISTSTTFGHSLISPRRLSIYLTSWAFTTMHVRNALAFPAPSLYLHFPTPQVGGLLPRRQWRQFATAISHQEDDDVTGETSKTTGGSTAVLSQRPLPTDASHLQMISFYCFEPVPDPWASRNELFASVQSIPGLRGTIYIAKEGINAQMAVPPGDPLDQLLSACSTSLPFDPFRESNNKPNLGDLVSIETPTFNRLIVRVRDYVLRDGITRAEDGSDSSLDWTDAGPELSPDEWHRELSSSSSQDSSSTPAILLDCRNLYESEQGTFQGAIPLQTDNFQESWPVLKDMTKDFSKDQPLHIFCTGGIRCVKVGAYLKQELGFQNVRRLQHGIIGYQQWIQQEKLQSDDDETLESLWQGENFIFDKRRSVDDETSSEDSRL